MKIQIPISSKEETSKATIYHIGSYSRGEDSIVTIPLEESKYYQFVYDDGTPDGTIWFSDSDTIHELFPTLKTETRDGNFSIPLYLDNESENRGIFGKIILKIIKVFVKQTEEGAVKKVALQLEENQLKGKSGLYQLDEKFNLTNFVFPNETSNKPYLLFIHGTNSETTGAFDGLKNTEVFNKMAFEYNSRIIAFNHRTLTVSPLTNAVVLAKLLPKKAKLHIISHSRGGLIGDILSLYASDNGKAKKGFAAEQIAYLDKEKRTNDLNQILELDEIFASKEITIEKFIRVASPSAGTILASERLDHIMNVMFNVLGDKANIIADLTHELIGSILEQKSNIDVLPGIEAMSPASPFIKVLNTQNDNVSIDGKSLIIISGNGKLSLNFHGLLVVLGKLFYLKRNDLVVNTDSMYLGVRRKEKIQYFFDEASYVDHVHYFKNRSTQTALLNVIKTPVGENVPGFKSVRQIAIPDTDRGLDGGELSPELNLPSGKKPILILLPGIMGSNIHDGKGSKIWLKYLRIITGGLKHMAKIDDKKSEAKSIIRTSYYKLYKQLSYTYDVIIFPFDWRQPMKDNAFRLNTKIIELMRIEDKPIKVIGHSMGGVLFRDFIIYHPNTWNDLNSRPDFKAIFLGAPLKGSHRILAVLFGKDSLINKLSMIDITHTTKELINIFCQLPGILSLLPYTESAREDYSDANLWNQLRIAFGDNTWPIPNKINQKGITVLEEFRSHRNIINNSSDKIDYSNMFYIAGQDKATACGYKIEKDKLIFEYTKEGDHSVTWESGIPKTLIDKNQVYYTDITHGDLANAPKLFGGIEEILSKGSTVKLSQVKPTFRDIDLRFHYQEHFDFDFSEEGLLNTLMGTTKTDESVPNKTPLNIIVSHGDLSYSSFHLMAGHFKNDAILYAEKAIDTNMKGILQQTLNIANYPGDIGTNDLFAKNTPHFEGALIIGLGEPGKLTSYTLSKTVEIGILNFLLKIKTTENHPPNIGISSLIIGCGYGGLTVSNSTTAIIEGIINANGTITNLYGDKGCTISQIEFIEQDEMSAVNCLFACRNLEINNQELGIFLENKTLKTLFGSKKKLRLENTNDWWNRIAIKSIETKYSNYSRKSLIFNASTGDAREEENELVSDASSINSFIQEVSVHNSWSEDIAKTLFELMIPNNFKDQLKRKGPISWVLDKDSAAYPWELLQDNSIKSKPLCIDSGMIRQLVTNNTRTNINRVMNNDILIIADPDLDGMENLNQLAGALSEGNAVEDLINKYSKYNVKHLKQASGNEITSTLFPKSFKIIHFAAHGNYDAENMDRTGIVIGKDNFLTTARINQITNVPELVFVNCCHLGKIDGVDDRLYHERYRLAANIGTQLIEMGVKAVIVAGWKVNDNDAHNFATTFYENMLNGESFGTSVKKARAKIYNEDYNSSNTWGAYQCYGDPYYKFDNRYSKKSEKEKEYLIEEEAYIDIENLYNSLDVRTTDSADKFMTETLQKLQIITNARDKAKFKNPEFSEMEALVYYELGLYNDADRLFKTLKANENAKFSVNSLEKYCNNKAYLHFENFNIIKENKKATPEEINIASSDAIEGLYDVLEYLNYLSMINETSERICLEASTYKRMGYVNTVAQLKKSAYEESVKRYKKAHEKKPIPYSFNNFIIFEAILNLHNKTSKKASNIKQTYLQQIDINLKQINNSTINMDYWEKADYTYSLLAKMFLDPTLSKKQSAWHELSIAYKDTRDKYGSLGKKKAERYNLSLIVDALEMTENPNDHFKILIKEITKLKNLLK